MNQAGTFAMFGILAIIVFIVSMGIAASMDAGWILGSDTFSELGISDTDAKIFFNYGLMITGALLALFGVGNLLFMKGAGYNIGGVLFIAAGIFLALVGLYPMDTDYHMTMVTCFAITGLLALIFSAIGGWLAEQKVLSGFSIIFVMIVVGSYYFETLAELEVVAAVVVALWLIIQSALMIIESKN